MTAPDIRRLRIVRAHPEVVDKALQVDWPTLLAKLSPKKKFHVKHA